MAVAEGPAGRPWASFAAQGSSALYEAAEDVPKRASKLHVSFPKWAGSVAEMLLEGKRVQVIGWQPYVCEAEVPPPTL